MGATKKNQSNAIYFVMKLWEKKKTEEIDRKEDMTTRGMRIGVNIYRGTWILLHSNYRRIHYTRTLALEIIADFTWSYSYIIINHNLLLLRSFVVVGCALVVVILSFVVSLAVAVVVIVVISFRLFCVWYEMKHSLMSSYVK